MAVFTVLEPPASASVAADAERIRFVREGFSWVALIVPFLWIVWHRLWLVGLGWLVLAIGLQAGANALGGPMPAIVGVGYGILFAFEANALRRWTLERRGFRFAGVVAGANRDECERRFFATWLIGRRLGATGAVAGAWSPAASPAATASASPSIIGLFPSPERPR